MPIAPPGIARRWAVVGQTVDHWECTTLFDLPVDDRTRLVLHPAAVTRYAVTLDAAAVRVLIDTIATGAACAVPAVHAEHGSRLLGLRPTTLHNDMPWTDRPADAPPYLGPMELYLTLPDAQIEIIFRRERLHQLTTILGMALAEMEDPGAR